MKMGKIASTLTRLAGDEAKHGISFDGYKWKIGETNGGNIEYMSDLSDLVKYASLFIKHLKRDGEIRNLAVSIPTEAYYSSKFKDDGGIIKKMTDEIRKNIPEAKDVVILPQGTAALSYLVPKKLVNFNNGNILVIDGGFNTLNASVTSSIGSKGKIEFSESIYDELGISDLLTKFFRVEIMRKFDEVSSNEQILKKIFLDEVIDAGFQSIDVRKEKKRAIEAFVPKLMNRITRNLKKKKISFGEFVIVGGLSYYITKENISTSKHFYIPEKDGEFLTVLGMKEIVGDDFDVFDVGFGDTKYMLKNKN